MVPADIETWAKIIDSLSDTAHVAEVGCGHSSVWLLRRLHSTQRYTGVEHTAHWADVARNEAQHHPDAEVRYVPVDGRCGSRGAYATHAEEVNDDGSADAYLSALDDVAGSIDCILIDGIVRSDYLVHLRSRLRPGCVVCLHDFTGREEWYAGGVGLYETIDEPQSPESLLVMRA